MARKWTGFPHADNSYVHDGSKLKQNWARLHRGDREPFPKDAQAQEAWRLFHAGEFQRAGHACFAPDSSQHDHIVLIADFGVSDSAISTAAPGLLNLTSGREPR